MAAVSDHSGTVPFKLGPDNDALASEVGEDGSGYSVPCLRLMMDCPSPGIASPSRWRCYFTNSRRFEE
jgi:hypothetical protein